MHALLRARNAGTASPVAFRVACERKRSTAKLTLDDGCINRDGDDAGPTCFDLDSVEKRYLLVGVIDGGARVYDTERFDGDDGAKKCELVCAVEGAGARSTGRREERDAGGSDGVAASSAYGDAFVSETRGHKYATSCVRWFPSDTGMFFTGSYDGAVKCWDANCLAVASETTSEKKCRAVALSSRATTHSLVAIGSDDAVVKLWDPASNVIAHTLSGHRGSVHAIEWLASSEYALATGGAEGDVRIWDIRRAGSYMIFDRHNTQPTAHVDAIKDAMYAGTSGTGGIIEAGPKPASRKNADAVPDHLRTDSARRCSSSGWRRNGDGGTGGGGMKRSREGGWGGWGVGFRGPKRSPRDGEGASSSKLFPSRDGYSSVAAPAHDGQVSGLKVTPCGMFIISTGADGRVRRWDLSSGLNTYTQYEEAQGAINTASACQLAITGDGERLFVPCLGGEVRVFRTHTGQQDDRLRGHMDDALACAYKDADAALLTVGKDQNILVWQSTEGRDDAREIPGDTWSDDDEPETDAYGRPSVVADPNSRHAGIRGLGYRSIAPNRNG
jgi:DNA excision repair protein ERCC-8